MRLRIAFSTILVFTTSALYAQSASSVPVLDRVGVNDLGIRPFGAYDGTEEKVNLENNNLNLSIPLVSLPGRNEFNLDLRLIYDSGFWRVQDPEWFSSRARWIGGWGVEEQNPFVADGWHLNWPTIQGDTTVLYPEGGYGSGYSACINTVIVILSDGSRHVFRSNTGCNDTTIQSEIPVMDSEDPDGAQLNDQDYGDEIVVTLRNGTKIYFPKATSSLAYADKIVDANGNVISQQGGSALQHEMTITDTVGRQITFNPSGTSGPSITYSDANGSQQTIAFNISAHSSISAPTGPNLTFNALNQTTYTEALLDSVTINSSSSEPQTYSFAYNSNAELNQITYPHQGCTLYDYSAYVRIVLDPLPGSGESKLGAGTPGVIAKHVYPLCSDSSVSYTTTYNAVNVSDVNNEEMEVVFPDGTRENHYFTQSSVSQYETYHGQTAQETEVDTLNSAGTLLKKVATAWTGEKSWDLPSSITTTYYNASGSVTTTKAFQYDRLSVKYTPSPYANGTTITDPVQPTVQTITRAINLPTSVTAYDWTGSSLSQSSISYDYDANTVLLNSNARIFGNPKQTVLTGSGGGTSTTQYYYDQNAPSSASAAQHESIATGLPRGNLTQIGRCVDAACSSVVITKYQVDDFGNIIQYTDSNNNSTYYSWQDSWDSSYSSACIPAAGASAYLSLITNAKGQKTSVQYRPCTGSRSQISDMNSQKTIYAYDSLNRIISKSLPNGGKTTITYNDAQRTVAFDRLQNVQGGHVISSAGYDGIGRLIQTVYGDTYTEYGYDGRDRKTSQTNPHLSQSASSDGTTQYTYDGLSRLVKATKPDNQSVTSDYSSFPCVIVTDETSRARKSCLDSLGRTLQVFEDPAGLNYETDYSYDALGNLTVAKQWGGAGGSSGYVARSFIYDSLSRLTSSTNPETGTTTYTYDNNGNLIAKTAPTPNSTTSGNTTTIGYSYDTLNRLCYVTNGTATANCPASASSNAIASYAYDSSSSSRATNTTGRVTAKTTLNNGTTVSQSLPYSYDAMGRLLAENQCPLGSCSSPYTMQYTYDLNGGLTSATNGEISSSVVNIGYGYDSAGRLCMVTNTGAPESCTLSSSSSALFYAQIYGAAGLLSAEYGVDSSGSASINQTRTYDNRFRMLSETDTGTSVTSSATSSNGTISISGTEQSTSVASSYGVATVTISGAETYTEKCRAQKVSSGDWEQVCTDTYATGTIGVTAGSFSATASYGKGSTSAALALSLASSLNGSGSPVTATVSGSVITLTSNTEGTSGNYAITLTSGDDFTLTSSSSTLTGGSNSTAYDTGTIAATINGTTSAVSWGQGGTANSIASSLASAINSADSSFLAATASGSSITLMSAGTGSSTNWSISTSVNDTSSSAFSSSSFSVSSSSMSGGADAGTSDGMLYSFNIPSSGGYAANDNLLSFTDSVIGSWSLAVTDSNSNSGYDTLNRMTAVYASSGMYAGMYGCWTYDAFGNRTMEAISSTACNANPTPSSWALYNGTANGTANNQMSATSYNTNQGANGYDIAGNVTYDGNNNYLYDIEGRLCAVLAGGNGGSVTGYLYNADGQRVAKGSMSSFACPTTASSLSTITSQYLLGQSSEQVTELDGSGKWVHTNVWASGRLIATYEGSDLYYAMTDWLGTKRTELGVSSKCTTTYSSLPFGNGLATITSSCPDATEHHYTGKERDIESGNDYFEARYYASSMGRFLSPDWSAKAEPVPHAKLDNPQSLNLYAYVGNNPLGRTDPNGHVTCSGGIEECTALKTGLDLAGVARDKLGADSVGGKAIGKVLDFYSTWGKDNGVHVSFGTLDKGTLGQETMGKNGTIDIKFDLGQINSSARNSSTGGVFGLSERAADEIHEGQHGVDDRKRGVSTDSRRAIDATEHNAYRTESYVFQGLGMNSAQGLWNSNWTSENMESNRSGAVDAAAAGSVAADCQGGGCKP